MHGRRPLALGIAALVCAGGGDAVTAPSAQYSTANAPPAIQALYRNTDRAEVNGEIELTAIVADPEARPSGSLFDPPAASSATALIF